MGLTSEQVHWILGGGLIPLALVLVLQEREIIRARWPRHLLGAALMVGGLAFVFDPLLHGSAAPENYEAETAQHAVQGGVLLAVGLIELLRGTSRLRARWWGLFLPVGLVAMGVTFLLHAQHAAAGPPILLVQQHRIIGATFLVAAATRGLSELGGERGRPLSVAWLVVLLLLGVEFALYTEGGAPNGTGHGGH